MNEIKLYEELKEAYETTTQKDNKFFKTISSINWDDCYKTEDGSTVFVKGVFELEVFNNGKVVNPFTETRKPSIMVGMEILTF